MDKPTPALPADDTPYARYTSDEHGGFINGVPARDLTRAEWLALDKATRALCRVTSLYTLIKDGAADG